jgi:hypothetical protein
VTPTVQCSLMTLRQAEVWLGMRPTAKGRGLLRVLIAREKELGKPILVRSRGKRRIGRYRVSRGALRRHCRHLLPSKVDELRDRFAEFLRGVDERIETSVTSHVAEHVDPQIEELWHRDEVQAEAIKELAIRLKRMAEVAANNGT